LRSSRLFLVLQLLHADLQQLHRPEQRRQLCRVYLQLRLLLELTGARCFKYPLLLLLVLLQLSLLLRLFWLGGLLPKAQPLPARSAAAASTRATPGP
jgi:hypothetical protein